MARQLPISEATLERAAAQWADATIALSPHAELFLIWRSFEFAGRRQKPSIRRARATIRDAARRDDLEAIGEAVGGLGHLKTTPCRLCEGRDELIDVYRECLTHGLNCSAEDIVTEKFVSEQVWSE